MHFVLEDHDATVLTAVHNKCVAGVKLDRLAVSGEACRQIGSSSKCGRPAWEVIAGFVDRVFGKRVEIVVAVNESLAGPVVTTSKKGLELRKLRIQFGIVSSRAFVQHGPGNCRHRFF